MYHDAEPLDFLCSTISQALLPPFVTPLSTAVFNTRSCVLEFTTHMSSNNADSDPRTAKCELVCKCVTELHKHSIDEVYVSHHTHQRKI